MLSKPPKSIGVRLVENYTAKKGKALSAQKRQAQSNWERFEREKGRTRYGRRNRKRDGKEGKRWAKYARRGGNWNWRNGNAEKRVHNAAATRDRRAGNAGRTAHEKTGYERDCTPGAIGARRNGNKAGINDMDGMQASSVLSTKRREAEIEQACNEEETSKEAGGTFPTKYSHKQPNRQAFTPEQT